MNESLINKLRKLRLSGLLETLEVRLHEAQSNNLTYAEFLELILQDELLVRDQRKIARRVKGATFRDLKSLEDFNWAFNPTIKRNGKNWSKAISFSGCRPWWPWAMSSLFLVP